MRMTNSNKVRFGLFILICVEITDSEIRNDEVNQSLYQQINTLKLQLKQNIEQNAQQISDMEASHNREMSRMVVEKDQIIEKLQGQFNELDKK